MDANKTLKVIEDGLKAGKSKKDLYQELAATQATDKERNSLAHLIYMVPAFAEREKYKILNGCLFLLLLVHVGLWAYPILSVLDSLKPIKLVFAGFIGLIYLFNLMGVARMWRYGYQFTFYLGLYALFDFLPKLSSLRGLAMVDFAFNALLTGLSFFLLTKVFPGTPAFSKLKKEPDGSYSF